MGGKAVKLICIVTLYNLKFASASHLVSFGAILSHLVGLDFAQLEQHIFKAYYFLAATIQTISKTKTYVKNKLAGRLYQIGLELKVPLRSNSITHIFNTSLKVTGDNQSRQFLSQT